MWTEATTQRLLRSMGLVPVVVLGGVAGCESEPAGISEAEFASELATSESGLSQAPPPGALSLVVPPSIDAGVWLSAQVTGADPGATVFVVGGPSVGAGPCPPVLNGTCVDVVSPVVMGSGTANAAGQVYVSFIVPHALPEGATLYLQAASPSSPSGDTSNVDAAVLTYPVRDCGSLPWLTPATVFNTYSFLACAPIPASGSCPTAASMPQNRVNALFRYASGQQMNWGGGGWSVSVWCDELTVEDACCYGLDAGQWAVGRPFTVGGQARVASAAGGCGWSEAVPVALSGLNRRERRRLAAAWSRTAHGEHASVASFARFVLHLLQLGAPASLVHDATAAMQDEVRHAQVSFSIASAFAGETLSAGPLDTAQALDAFDLTAIVLDTVREGCVAETIAAAQAEVARDACTDPAIRAALDLIVADEQRHSELAWRFVQWALAAHPELAPAVAAAFSEALNEPLVAVDPHADVLRAYGQLAESEMQQVARRVHHDVVLPCARALLVDHPVGVGLAA